MHLYLHVCMITMSNPTRWHALCYICSYTNTYSFVLNTRRKRWKKKVTLMTSYRWFKAWHFLLSKLMMIIYRLRSHLLINNSTSTHELLWFLELMYIKNNWTIFIACICCLNTVAVHVHAGAMCEYRWLDKSKVLLVDIPFLHYLLNICLPISHQTVFASLTPTTTLLLMFHTVVFMFIYKITLISTL